MVRRAPTHAARGMISRPPVVVQYSETIVGAAVEQPAAEESALLAGAPLAFQVRVQFGSLETFAERNRALGTVIAGTVSWEGRLDDVPLERNGHIQLIRDGRIAGVSRIRMRVRALVPDGSRMTFHIERTLDPLGKPYDSSVEVRVRGGLIGRGVLFDPPRGYDQHISDVEVSGGTARQRKQAQTSFLKTIRSAPRDVEPPDATLEGMVHDLIDALHTPVDGEPTVQDIVVQYMELLDRVPAWRRNSIVRFLEGNIGSVRFFRQATRLLIRNPAGRVVNVDSLDAAHNLYQFLYYTLQKSHPGVGHGAMELGEPSTPPQHPKVGVTDLNRLGLRREPDGWTLEQEFDCVIVGSGPAGSLLANRLGRTGRVLVLEKGPAVPEGLSRATDNAEFDSYTRLYEGAGLQAANDDWGELNKEHGSIFILQGSCVGGGGMVNNSICVRMSDERIRRWMKEGFPLRELPSGARVRNPEDILHAAYDVVAKEMGIVPLRHAVQRRAPTNAAADLLDWSDAPAASAFERRRRRGGGVKELLLAKSGCVGCGFCNVGCAYGAKRSAYSVYLRSALEAHDRDVVLAADSEVVEIRLTDDRTSVDHLVVEIPRSASNPALGKRRVRVRAREFILSAGAGGSSVLLLKSPDVRDLDVAPRIGTRFTANLAVPLIAVYKDAPQKRRGLQMTHSYVPPRGEDLDGWVIETWSSEPGGFSLGVPGYFNAHRTHMKRYGRSTAAVVLVGSDPELGSVHWYDPAVRPDQKGFDPVLAEAKIRPDPRKQEHLDPRPYLVIRTRKKDARGRLVPEARRLKDAFRNGLRHLARTMLDEGGDVLERVVVPSRHGWTIRNRADIDLILGAEADLEDERPLLWQGELRDVRSLRITSAHPQGGNPMRKRGVVGSDFRVEGLDNLRICDASIFPDNAGVNPQWTVLALAHLCAERIRLEQQPRQQRSAR